VANGIKVPFELYFPLYSQDPDLEEVIHALGGRVGYLTKVSQSDGDLQAWLLRQSQGIFAVEAGNHCFTWDCDRQLLLDTDPRFPHPLQATVASLAIMGCTLVKKAYKLAPTLLQTKKPSRNARRRHGKHTVWREEERGREGEREEREKGRLMQRMYTVSDYVYVQDSIYCICIRTQ
jgi:hypothetical protein